MHTIAYSVSRLYSTPKPGKFRREDSWIIYCAPILNHILWLHLVYFCLLSFCVCSFALAADQAISEMNRKEKDIIRAYRRAVRYASHLESRVRIMLVGDTGTGE